MSNKRQRTVSISRPTAKRPISKEIKVVTQATIDATQVNTSLFTATYPATVVGLRWSLTCAGDAGTVEGKHQWIIQLVKESITIPGMATSDGSSMVTPEQNVLAFGAGISLHDNYSINYIGDTKTMRKLQGGDRIIFSAIGVATNTTRIHGAIQFFLKT